MLDWEYQTSLRFNELRGKLFQPENKSWFNKEYVNGKFRIFWITYPQGASKWRTSIPHERGWQEGQWQTDVFVILEGNIRRKYERVYEFTVLPLLLGAIKYIHQNKKEKRVMWNVMRYIFIFPSRSLGTWENILLNRTCNTFYLSFRRVAATFGFVEERLAFALSGLFTIILCCLSPAFLFQGSI